jgi:hypothetical protein
MTTSAMSMYGEIHVNSLLASTFSHPRGGLASPFLDALQKRRVLATWASDALLSRGCLGCGKFLEPAGRSGSAIPWRP